MAFFLGLLTFILVLDCVLLILLVLVQLPKKEAGAGLAFGGAATDALFGAGSGNVLTKITKYAAAAFFVLAIGLGVLQGAFGKRNTAAELQRELEKLGKQPTSLVTPPPAAEQP
ncbi:MAG TPA: preprotein translocase subunit SecG, partial [Verrucomicrobiae bacterium]